MVASSRTHPLHGGPNPPGGSLPPQVPNAASARAPGGDPLTMALLHFGLGAREAQLYRTLLKFGPMSARQSIGLAGLDRATGYRVLSKLRARGLVSSTPSRPQRFVPLEVARLFERTVTVLRDDLEFLRVLREHYMVDGSHATGTTRPMPTGVGGVPPRTRWPTVRVYPRSEEIAQGIIQLAESAKEELEALMMPQVIPEPLRVDVARAVGRCVERGVRVRVVVDYHPIDLEFLAAMLKSWASIPHGFEFRFFAPQFARLYLVDHRMALRCIRSAGSASLGPELGLSSDDAEFVRYQSTRFQAVWREALPMQRAESGMTQPRSAPALGNPRDLRRWVERGAVVTGRLAGAEFARLFGLDLGFSRRL
ncbi:MAG TPA: helix-turn-helix domain-containing protein [Thermoplasmata archaeon]|nr:helix-turn-helix domain-containing protein [Thermoplasmata archaeon]